MLDHTPRFARYLPGDHTPAYRIESLLDGQTIDTLPFGDPTLALPTGHTVTGNISVQRAATRRQLRLQVVDPSGILLVDQAADLLGVYGTELRIHRGIRYPDGTTELLPIGTFGIVGTNETYPTIDIDDADDRSERVAGELAALEHPLVIPAATNIAEAIADLLEPPLGGLAEFIFVPTSVTTPTALPLDAGADRWEAAGRLAAIGGYQLYFDPLGALRLEPEPDPESAPPVVTFSTNPDQAAGELPIHGRVSRRRSRRDTANVWIVTGQAPDDAPPVQATVTDTNQDSPTRVDGPLGRRVRRVDSQTATTAVLAESEAATLAQREAGIVESLEFETVPHPGLEAGDVVRVVDARLGVDVAVVVDSFNIPIGDGKMRVATRARRVILA